MEDTIAEQEQKEKRTNHKQELADLEAESELSMEELYKKYAAAYDEDFEAQLSEPSTDVEDESELDSDDEEEEEEEGNVVMSRALLGLMSLMSNVPCSV